MKGIVCCFCIHQSINQLSNRSVNPLILDTGTSFRTKVVSFGETVPTRHLGLDLNFVPLESCNPGVGEFFPVPYNHMDICKPENKKSILFRSQTLHTIVVRSLFYRTRPFEILEQNSFPAGGTICNSIQFLKNLLFF